MPSKANADVTLTAKRKGSRAFGQFQKDLGNLAKTASVIGAAAAAALTVVTKRAFENIDALAKTADALSITTEKLAGYQLAAQVTGVGQEQFNKALLRQQKTIFDAQQGLTTATRALDVLGLEVEDLIGLSADEQFAAIAEAMGTVENATLRSGAAAQIFGARNVAVLKTLDLGREGLEAYAAEAERVGLAVSRVDAAKIEQANDAMLLARQRVQGIGNVIAVQLAPVVTSLATAFHQSGIDAETMGRTVARVLDGLAFGAGIVADAFHGWRLIFATIELGIKNVETALIRFDEKFVKQLTDADKAIEALEVSRARAVAAVADKSAEIQAAAAASFDVQIAFYERRRTIDNDRLEIAEAELETAREYVQALSQAERPSERIAANLAQARIEAQTAAEETARAAAQGVAAAGADAGETEDEARARDAAEKAAQRLREQQERELEQVRTFTLTREQVEIEATQRRLAILRTALEENHINEVRFQELAIAVAQKGSERLTQIALEGLSEREKFERASARRKAQIVVGTLVEMTEGVAQHNRTLFDINKAASLATAIVNTHEAVTAVLADKSLPTFARFALAAVAAAKGAAEIQAIRSTSFEGGGAGTTPSSVATPVVNSQPVGSPGGLPALREERDRGVIVNIHVDGNLGTIDSEGARVLAETITDAMHDRDFEFG